MARKLEVIITGDARSLERALGTAANASRGFGSTLGHVARGAAFALGGAALGGIAVTLKAGIGEWEQSSKVAAQTAAVLKSTGGAAGVTSKQVDTLATSLMRKSGIDDETIKSGENLLLTFTGIRNEVGKGNDIFNQATKVATDMSVALGQDMKSSAIQVGKALNDPVKGVTALQRVGVSFTKSQKEQIKALVDSGHTLDAQKLIVRELTKEFGGSAEAAGKTLPGQLGILRESFNNLAGDIVAGVTPALQRAVTWTTQHWPEISATFHAVFSAIGWAFTNVLEPTIAALITAGEAAVSWVRSHWPEISATATRVFDTVRQVVLVAINVVTTLWKTFGSEIVSVARSTWQLISSTVQNAMSVIRGIVNLVSGVIHGDWSQAWEGVKQITSGAINQVLALFRNWQQTGAALFRIIGRVFVAAWESEIKLIARVWTGIAQLLWAGITSAASHAGDLARAGGAAIMDGLRGGLRAGWNTITGWLTSIPGWMKGFFGGAASWLVDAGQKVITGLIDGILSKLGALKDTLGGVGSKIVSWKGPPEADAVLLVENGRLIMKGLIQGILSQMPQVEGAAKQAAQRITAGAQAGEILQAVQQAGRTLGAGHALSIAQGILQGAPGIVTQVRVALQQAIAAAHQAIDAARTSFSSAFGSLAQAALGAFDEKVASWVPRSQRILEKMQLEDQLNAVKDAVAQAQAQLASAQQSAAGATQQEGETPEAFAARQQQLQTAVVDAQKQLGAAERQQKELNVQLAAAGEERAHAATVTRQREHLAAQLAALRTDLAKHPEEWRTTQAKIKTILDENGVPMFKAGQRLASQFADGLSKGIAEVVKAARALADALEPITQSAGGASTTQPPGGPHRTQQRAAGALPGASMIVAPGGGSVVNLAAEIHIDGSKDPARLAATIVDDLIRELRRRGLGGTQLGFT